ncbi:MAG: hypothetical protein AAF614_31355 [Chloroflexota bacterium]
MNGRLHNLTLQFSSNSAEFVQQWHQIFAGWLVSVTSSEPDIHFSLELRPSLPPPPSPTPFFVDEEQRIVSAYRGANNAIWLHYLDGALLEVPFGAGANHISGVAEPRILAVNGRFEDIIFTSLAPLLRRRGLFLVHAFAASKNGRCALFVGPSHSGKTTTGLNLLLNGWELLANDVVLLEPRRDGVYAWPTPGTLGIRTKTFDLLPTLQTRLGLPTPQTVEVTAEQLVNSRWAEPACVEAIFFPEVRQGGETAVLPHNRAIALTQLMSESIDRWDSDTLNSHITCLQQLCRQATPYRLHLGQDMAQMAQAISSQVAE